MKTIAVTENPLLIRTDFSNTKVWENIKSLVENPVEPFIFKMSILDDQNYEGVTVEELLAALPESRTYNMMVIADPASMTLAENPLLVVDLNDKSGLTFRALPGEIAAIENNLSICNLDFKDYTGALDKSGIFRGFT